MSDLAGARASDFEPATRDSELINYPATGASLARRRRQPNKQIVEE
jgi:hypothetical protein